jgi:hypothetical protein
MVRASASDKVCATPDLPADPNCNGPVAPQCVDASGNTVDCSTPGAKPAFTQPCKPGRWACVGGLVCIGAVTKTADTDACGQDLNCDGRLDNQPNLKTDVFNCGTCGNDCNAKGAHVNWTCNNGVCQIGPTKCRNGYIDCDANANDCERACTKSGAEQCNGFDDDCNCKIDDGVTPPLPTQVCGVNPAASDPNCGAGNGTTGIKVACTSGTWQCTFPAGYCSQGGCLSTPDTCDGKDNNCNGNTDENQKPPVLNNGYVGEPCNSDDGKPPPGDGACRVTGGTYVCNGPNATKCNVTKDLSKAQPETCDGVDNDCDGLVDETFNNKGTNATYFVKPAVVQINASPAVYMYQYEASRPSASTITAGSGNGYFTSAPTGVTLDKTPSCSVPNKIPWFNVTPAEVEQTCSAMGGFICSTPNWTTACQAGGGCTYGYATGCTAPANYTSGPFCNLGPFDYDGVAGPPNVDNVLVTKSSRLNQCSTSTNLFDITGNLREITKRATEDYPLMGGAFNTATESGAACDFAYYSVPSTLKLYDTGFRCCFSSNPGQ